MTENKPIIRHGINVSDCEYLTHKNSFNPMCGNTGICCYGRKDCYFKQLARKTQECKELKKDRINIIKENAKDYRKLQQAEQKLEKIWEICKHYIDLPSYEFVKILQIIDEVEND